MLYEDNEGLVRLQVDDNGGDDVNHDDDNDDGDADDIYHYDDYKKCFHFLQNPIYLND